MHDLDSVIPGAVKGVMGGGEFGAFTLGSCAWGRGCVVAGLVGVGALVAVVRGGDGTGAGLLSKILYTPGL